MHEARGINIWALTGGAASGKSMACDLIESLVPGMVRFDSDGVVDRLLKHDRLVHRDVRQALGDEVVDADGQLDRSAMRARVFGSESDRRKMESILHPRVRKECLESLATACKMSAPLFLAEVPLLFESQFNFGQEWNLLVAVRKQTQLKRLQMRSGVTKEMANTILSCQWSTERKIEQADAVFWNEGPNSLLKIQLSRFLSTYHHE